VKKGRVLAYLRLKGRKASTGLPETEAKKGRALAYLRLKGRKAELWPT
jgi:hypothetical protein